MKKVVLLKRKPICKQVYNVSLCNICWKLSYDVDRTTVVPMKCTTDARGFEAHCELSLELSFV
jgi:hypothetical protein